MQLHAVICIQKGESVSVLFLQVSLARRGKSTKNKRRKRPGVSGFPSLVTCPWNHFCCCSSVRVLVFCKEHEESKEDRPHTSILASPPRLACHHPQKLEKWRTVETCCNLLTVFFRHCIAILSGSLRPMTVFDDCHVADCSSANSSGGGQKASRTCEEGGPV